MGLSSFDIFNKWTQLTATETIDQQKFDHENTFLHLDALPLLFACRR